MKNKRTWLFLFIALLLIFFQLLLIGVAMPRGYYLIYDWMFFAINYAILLFLFLAFYQMCYMKWLVGFMCLGLLTANTVFLYAFRGINVEISKPEDESHEVILKEYPNLKFETVRLKRRGILFGEKTDVLKGSSEYKPLEEKAYNIEWVSGDTAVLTYLIAPDGPLEQNFFFYRSTDYIRYQYILTGLMGKWVQSDNPENYLLFDGEAIVVANDGELTYYNPNDTEQHNILALTVKGEDQASSFNIILNPDAEYTESGILDDDSSITVLPITLEDHNGTVYEKVQ